MTDTRARHTVTKIHHEARRPSRSVQDTRARNVHGVHVETLKNDLRHALSVSLGVQKGVREQSGNLFRRNTECVVERVMQYFSMSFQFMNITGTLEVKRAVSAAKHLEPSTPGNGVNRVRRRRFAEVRSGSTTGGPGNGGSAIGGSRSQPSQPPLSM